MHGKGPLADKGLRWVYLLLHEEVSVVNICEKLEYKLNGGELRDRDESYKSGHYNGSPFYLTMFHGHFDQSHVINIV